MMEDNTYLSALPFPLDLLQTPRNLLLLLLIQDTSLEERLGECNRPLDVGSVHALVILQRLVELVHERVGRAGETAAAVSARIRRLAEEGLELEGGEPEGRRGEVMRGTRRVGRTPIAFAL